MKGKYASRNENILHRFCNNTKVQEQVLNCNIKDLNGVLLRSLIEKRFPASRIENRVGMRRQPVVTLVGFLIIVSYFLSLKTTLGK